MWSLRDVDAESNLFFARLADDRQRPAKPADHDLWGRVDRRCRGRVGDGRRPRRLADPATEERPASPDCTSTESACGFPPAGRVRFSSEPPAHIPVVRFPRWYYCSEPECRRLDTYGHLVTEGRAGASTAAARLVPSRFIAVCEQGHIEDFPYWHWVHAGITAASEGRRHELTLQVTGASGSLAGIVVECKTCELRALAGGRVRPVCAGRRQSRAADSGPGLVARRVRVRKAAANHPARCVERLVPQGPIGAVDSAVERRCSAVRPASLVDASRWTSSETAARQIVPNTDRRVGRATSRPRRSCLRSRSERGLRLGEKSDREIRDEEFGLSAADARRIRARVRRRTRGAPGRVSSRVRSRHDRQPLREVRALHRIHPTGAQRTRTSTSESDRTDDVEWLPAIPVQGEGVFLRLDDSRFAAGRTTPDVKARVDTLEQRWSSSFFNDGER